MRMRQADIALILLGSILGSGCAANSHVPSAPTVEDLSASFAHAKDELERRTVLLQAIDAQIIQNRVPVKTVVDICGKYCDVKCGELSPNDRFHPESRWYGRIMLREEECSRNGSEGTTSSPYRGWYMTIEYNDDDRITAYWLSNWHWK